jgi:ribulose-5-phosphate 4-epimerase/fuculose-1-phosphate aldolase
MPSTVHKARPEVACVLHAHSIAGCAVSMQRDGLLPLNQHALQVIGDRPRVSKPILCTMAHRRSPISQEEA